MGGRASRTKGHDFERWVARRFREVFPKWTVSRGAQFVGAVAPDVVTPLFWTECKRGKRTNPKAALAQAITEQKNAAAWKPRTPIAVCKDDREDPTVTMLLDDFLKLVEAAEE